MPIATDALIHHFGNDDPPSFDGDGDIMLGWYYQFIDKDEAPVSGLYGPYFDDLEASKAAKRAFKRKDFT